MYKKLIILIITLILISGCSTQAIKPNKIGEAKVYTIEEGENDEAFFYKSREKRNELNKWYYYNNLEDEEKERLIEEKTGNWRRVIDNELVVGYDKEEDELFYKFQTIEDLEDC